MMPERRPERPDNPDHLASLAAELDGRLAAADEALASRYPGERGIRQPVHTVYVPAHAAGPGLVDDWRDRAVRALDEHASSASTFAAALGMTVDDATYERIHQKLMRQPIEDLRIDFEDGYGTYPDDEEDVAAITAATTVRALLAADAAPAYLGIRFKSLEAPTRARGLRTLDLFLGELARTGASDPLPAGLRLTLPKVTSVEQVEAMTVACSRLERAYGLTPGTLGFELQVETPQAVVGPDGRALVAPMIHAAGGRCTGLHYGTYDYSASLGIAGAYQSMEHPAADHAKDVMQVAAAETGVLVSDGSTNIVPVGDQAAVHAAWRLHARLVRRALERGIYQGWDLHPAQLPSRYAAVFGFFAEGLPEALARLTAYADGGSATGFLDEPATAKALRGFVARAVDCGAADGDDVVGGRA